MSDQQSQRTVRTDGGTRDSDHPTDQFDVCWGCRDAIPDDTLDEWPLIRCFGDKLTLECKRCGTTIEPDEQYVHVVIEA